ncbi:DUF2948 family protein [Alphaproteobacteria bacterium]|nr:DUF2948 family protein [Alphaproteobacteria bacterium]
MADKNATDKTGLRLRARDDADLEVLSALLQDAILPGSDLHYDTGSGRVIMVVNRFCWENDPLADVTNEDGGPVFERALCGIQFHTVTKVLQLDMPNDRRAALLNILAVQPAAMDGGETAIDILFSGGATLRLVVDEIEILAEDIEDTRPSMIQPDHGAD